MLEIFGSRLRYSEIVLVKAGEKPAARLSNYEQESDRICRFLDSEGLFYAQSDFRIFERQDQGKGGFSNIGIKIKKDSPVPGYNYIYVSRNRKMARDAMEAERMDDSQMLGQLLGYPGCCIDAFITNSPMQKLKQNDFVSTAMRPASFPYQNNICARYLDYSLLSHFPCNFGCRESYKLASRYEKALSSLSYIGEIRRMLKGLVIYTEYDGVFLLEDCRFSDSEVTYKSIHSTIKNNIFDLLKARHLDIIDLRTIRVGRRILENAYIGAFR